MNQVVLRATRFITPQSAAECHSTVLPQQRNNEFQSQTHLACDDDSHQVGEELLSQEDTASSGEQRSSAGRH